MYQTRLFMLSPSLVHSIMALAEREEMKRFVLRIDIEGVNAEEDCFRPVDDYILLESDKAEDVENLYAVLQNDIKKINDWEIREKIRDIEYSVFMWMEDEFFETGASKEELLDSEQWDLGRYTNWTRAKKLMRQAIKRCEK